MTHEQIQELLSGVDLFRHLPAGARGELASRSSLRTLGGGEILFEYGSTGSSMFVILAGELQLFRNRKVTATVRRGQYIGELALMFPAPRSTAARAHGEAQLLEISADTFNAFVRSDPEALAALTRTITQRLRNTLDETYAAYESLNMLIHDLLNSVCVLQSAEIVRDMLPEDDEAGRAFLDSILRARVNLETQMRGALNRARGMSGTYSRQAQDIETVLRECLGDELAMHPDVSRARVELDVQRPLAPVPCNALDLKRVLANLVINAAQSRRDGAVIVMCLWQSDGRTFIAVRDNGCGIPPALGARIFEPHFTTKAAGNGLGLSSCRDIIERLHGGRLSCESREGVGTTFVCELPMS